MKIGDIQDFSWLIRIRLFQNFKLTRIWSFLESIKKSVLPVWFREDFKWIMIGWHSEPIRVRASKVEFRVSNDPYFRFLGIKRDQTAPYKIDETVLEVNKLWECFLFQSGICWTESFMLAPSSSHGTSSSIERPRFFLSLKFRLITNEFNSIAPRRHYRPRYRKYTGSIDTPLQKS